MGLPSDAAWEKFSQVFLKIALKTEKDISVLHNGASPRCSNVPEKKSRVRRKGLVFFTWFEKIQIAVRDLLE